MISELNFAGFNLASIGEVFQGKQTTVGAIIKTPGIYMDENVIVPGGLGMTFGPLPEGLSDYLLTDTKGYTIYVAEPLPGSRSYIVGKDYRAEGKIIEIAGKLAIQCISIERI